mgnify:CR=1 FL=1
MAQTAFHVETVQMTGSEKHNTRSVDVEYSLHHADPELTSKNENWIDCSIHDKLKEVEDFAKQKGGRKLRSDAKPIKEAIVVIEDHHDIDDLKKLANDLNTEHKIDVFQIHIHKDEGVWQDENGKTQIRRKDHKWVDNAGTEVSKPDEKSNLKWKPNLHAHVLFACQHKEDKIIERKYKKNKKTPPVMRKYNLKGTAFTKFDLDYSKMQTTTAISLGMERGTSKEITKREHLTPYEYKAELAEQERREAQARTKELQLECEKLEQKKNTATEANRIASEGYRKASEDYQRIEDRNKEIEKRGVELLQESFKDHRAMDRYTDEEIESAISNIDRTLEDYEIKVGKKLEKIKSDIRNEENQHKRLEREFDSIEGTDEFALFKSLESQIRKLEDTGKPKTTSQRAGEIAEKGGSTKEIFKQVLRKTE